jgi:branched-chain amino acid transport system permease protein
MEPILMRLLGGTRFFLGPAVGAIIFTGLRETVSSRFELYWMLVLGAILVVIILVLPGGVAESIQRGIRYVKTIRQE